MSSKPATFLVIAVSVLLLGATIATGVGTVSAERYNDFSQPTLEPTIQGENVVAPGETKRFDLMVQNRHEGTTETDQRIDDIAQVVQTHRVNLGAASAVTASVESADAPLEVKTGTQSLGTIDAGSGRQTSLSLEVDENASPGTYRVPVTMEYEYVRGITVDSNDYIIHRNTETVTKYVTIRVEKSVRLDVSDATSQGIYKNADGSITVTVRNDGTEVARNAELTMIESEHFRPRSEGVSIGRLEPDETATATFQTGTSAIDTPGEYPAKFRLSYENENGNIEESRIRTGSVPVSEGPSFEFTTETEELYVDSIGAVTVTVMNTGNRTATDARVVLDPIEPFSLLSSQSNLGTLDPGESATARFKLEASDRTIPQEYPLTFSVIHDDIYAKSVESEKRSAAVTVEPEKEFTVVETTDLTAGSTETLEMTIENTGGGTLSDAEVRINTNSPFETDDDTAYVGTLEPGETVTVTFTVTTDEDATPKEYSLDTTIKHDNAFGETVVTDIESAPVTVTSAESRLPLLIGIVLVILAMLVIGIAYRNRLRSRLR
ncbi:COG1361 S-layer family protein [Halopenitus sp. H-Gu1]|uniref:COG1361 S-layer family protein n=1 Tax=Halopenitus sp. H-Gu1 TaxID=3242697 RepID=UPI00359D4D92